MIAENKKRKCTTEALQHTLDHLNCAACLATNEMVMNIDVALPELGFKLASERWLEWQRPYVHPNTVETYEQYLGALDKFFYGLKLKDIHAGHLREYQVMRAGNLEGRWKRTAGASSINHELNTLSQILAHAGLWKDLKSFYKPLKMPRWTPPRVMTDEEEERLFTVAASNPELELAYLVASITNNTSASGCELRNLQLKHLRLRGGACPEVLIPSDVVKNEHRGRRIPLNEIAAKQFEQCLKRAYRLGSTSQDHYLFPFRKKRNTYDPTRPASRYWLRGQFGKLREAAGIPWLRPHDLRHQAITRMLECGAPEQTIKSIAGHVSQQMLEHYSHIRMEAKMAVLQKINPGSFRVAQMREQRRA